MARRSSSTDRSRLTFHSHPSHRLAMAASIRLSFFCFLSLLITSGLAFPAHDKANDVDVAPHGMVSAKINKLFDTMLPNIQKVLLKFGLDPMEMMNMNQPLKGILDPDGVLEMKDGWLQGLSELTRAGDIVLDYSNKILNVHLELGFDVLDIGYEYYFKYGLIKRSGDFHGSFTRVKLHITVTVDMTTKKVTLDSLKIVDMGKLDVKLEGHVLDPLLNVVIKGFTTIFRQCVVEFIEQRFIIVFKRLLNDLNEMIQDLDKQIPTFNQVNMIPMFNQLNTIPMLDQLNKIPMLKKLKKIQIMDEPQDGYDSTLNDAETTFTFQLV